VTVATFDRFVVRQLGLSDLARGVQDEAQRAGLQPPSRFGSEVVARQIGLRFNHPSQDDRLELYPSDTITRAEAAYSFARVLALGYEPQYAREVLEQFVLPRYSDAQKRALRVAVSKIGMPYIWGGESDSTGGTYGPQAHGGYDCSGFAWRVFKLSGDPAGTHIGGRTAAQMAGEIKRGARIPFDSIRPADLLFFGSASFRARRATESNVTHMGIALSGKFMIHSSSQGVYVSPLFEGWRRSEFAWARRVL
jgi:cell wall-associated NlpC family hydrolase